MKSWEVILFLIMALVIIPATNFAQNLTSCVGCSQVTCPAGSVCHNVGTCPNGFVLWGCVYSNGTVVSKAIPNTTASTIPTTTPTTTPTTAPATTPTTIATTAVTTIAVPATTNLLQSWTVYAAIVIVIIVVLLAYYLLVSRKKR